MWLEKTACGMQRYQSGCYSPVCAVSMKFAAYSRGFTVMIDVKDIPVTHGVPAQRHGETIARLKKTGRPAILTVNARQKLSCRMRHHTNGC